MTIKSYELRLPYYKQGDDLASCVDDDFTGITPEASAAAFLQHAEMLEAAATQLRTVAGAAIEHGLTIQYADTHAISVKCDDNIGELLVTAGLLSEDPFLTDFEDTCADCACTCDCDDEPTV